MTCKLPEEKTAHKFFPSRGRWPRLLFLGVADNAGLANRLARACNTYARSKIARVWTLTRNPFGYPEDMIGPPPGAQGDFPAGLVQWFRYGVDWIVTAGDGDYDLFVQMLDVLAEVGVKAGGLAVTHSGSVYRANHEELNRRDWEMGAKVRFIGMDSMRFATVGFDRELNEAIPTFPYWASFDPAVLTYRALDNTTVRVAHSPSHRATKGTEGILRVLNKLAFKNLITYDLIEGVTVDEASERRSRCHIFVDQMNPEVGGFGCSAVEAMAVGCAVIGDVRFSRVVGLQHYRPETLILDHPPVTHVETEEELEKAIVALVNDRVALTRQRDLSQEWVVKNASPEAVGERFLRLLEDGWQEELDRLLDGGEK